MEHMKKYSIDYAKPLILLMDYFNIGYVKFFNNDKSFIERNWQFFYVIPLMGLHFAAMSVYVINVFAKGKDVFEEALILPIFIVTVQANMKGLVVVYNKHQLENIIEELGAIWRTDNLNDVQKAVKISSEKELRKATSAYMRLPKFVAWLYLIMPLIRTMIYNVILSENDDKLLPFSCAYPFDPCKNWIIYGVVYVHQVYCMFVVAYTYLSSDFLLITLSAHLSVEFMLLREDLIHIKPNKATDTDVPHNIRRNGCIREFVRNHQRLIILAQKLDGAVNKMMFINMAFTTVNITFFGLASMAANTVVDKVLNFVVVFTVIFLIFILCYFCEKLKAASEEIFYAATENLWYEGDKEYKTIIRFIMFRSLKPCYITSLKYAPTTLSTFTKVLSTTWSYFSLVSTMYKHSH